MKTVATISRFFSNMEPAPAFLPASVMSQSQCSHGPHHTVSLPQTSLLVQFALSTRTMLLCGFSSPPPAIAMVMDPGQWVPSITELGAEEVRAENKLQEATLEMGRRVGPAWAVHTVPCHLLLKQTSNTGCNQAHP